MKSKNNTPAAAAVPYLVLRELVFNALDAQMMSLDPLRKRFIDIDIREVKVMDTKTGTTHLDITITNPLNIRREELNEGILERFAS